MNGEHENSAEKDIATQPTMEDVLNRVASLVAPHWYQIRDHISLALDLDSDSMGSVVKMNNKLAATNCCKEMLSKCLKTSRGSTIFNQLIKALNSIKLDKIAEEIKLLKNSLAGISEQYTTSGVGTHDEINQPQLSNDMSTYRKFLQSRYNSLELISIDDCSPSLTLVKIDKQGRTVSTENSRDDYVTLSEALDIDDKIRTMILIEGNPEMEKTTLAVNICKCWAEGSLLQNYNAVILLPLNNKRIQEAQTVDELLQTADDELNENLITEITRDLGEKICFIIEGYDELPHQCSVLTKLKKYLPECMLLYITHPEACDKDSLETLTSRIIKIEKCKENSIDDVITNMKITSIKNYKQLDVSKLYQIIALLKSKDTTALITLYAPTSKNRESKPSMSPKFTDIEKIFHNPFDNNHKRVILIEGHPGIGKTTLANEIGFRWAKGELLTSCKLLLILPLRDPTVQKISSLKEFVSYFTHSTKEKSLLCSYLENKGNVTIILDGFDELNNKLHDRSFFMKLIQGQCLPKARIVVTSRPQASACLHGRVDQRVLIFGFSRDSREQYTNDALKGFSSETLWKHLQQHPGIDALCYTPSVMAIITFVYLHQPDELPSTASKLYKMFVLLTIYHYVKKEKMTSDDITINEIEKFPQSISKVLQQLQKFAFKSLVENKSVFTEEEILDVCQGNLACFGLIQSIEHVHSSTKSFHFVNFSVQEYLAACYITSLQSDEADQLFKKVFSSTGCEEFSDHRVRFSNMWMFCCGLTDGKDVSLWQMYTTENIELFSNNDTFSPELLEDPTKIFYSSQCFQEAQDDRLCEVFSTSFNDKILNLRDKQYLIPHHIESLGIFLASTKWTKLILSNCQIGDDGIILLHRYLCRDTKKDQEISVIDLMENNLTDVSLPLISEIIIYCCPYILRLGCNQFSSLEDITKAVIISSAPKVLDMWGCNITAQGAKAIVDMMSHIVELVISNNNLSDEGAKYVAQGLVKTKSLQVLYIVDNKIGSEGIVTIARGLSLNTSLKVLNMTNNVIDQDGARAIADAILNNNTLDELFLWGTLNEESAILLLEKLCNSNNTITKLGLPEKLFTNNCIISYMENINFTRKRYNKQGIEFDFY
ncbi:NLR family CARD domain-containing protein 3-like [Dysidea avara]|uniref:NLR family CARD domain-containing protein 3-like n=1 Tax=Dysidea avara TaxID=196820 RepID=UPI0033321262